MPLIFGWLVLRRGYHPGVRAVVLIYMVISLIPVYMLVSILWNSGDEVKRLAKDYDKNRAVAERNSGVAQQYMDQYEKGDLDEGRGPAAPAAQAASPAAPIAVTSAALARRIEADRTTVTRMTGHPITVTGTMTGAPQGGRVFLAGGELYPAVILEYAGTPPGEGDVSATCSTIRLETIGPILGGCQ